MTAIYANIRRKEAFMSRERDTFILKASHYKMFAKRLTLEQKGHLLDAIFCDRLGLNYEEHIQDDLIGVIFETMQDFYLQCDESYRIRSEKNKANANKRWGNDTEDANASNCMQSHNSQCLSKSKSKSKSKSLLQRECIEKVADAPARSRFQKPSIEEVKKYVKNMGYYGFDVEHFYSYYESNGWKVGKNPMKDWTAAVRSWRSRDKAVSQDYISRTQLPDPSVYEHTESTI